MPKAFNVPQLELGKEYPLPNEDYYVDKAIVNLKKALAKRYKTGETMRSFHPKMHGCVRAELIVGQGLPSHLYGGIFQEGKSYPAWIRFSNAKPKVTSDYKKNARGAAIKVMGVEGEKLLEDRKDAKTQDFVMFTDKTLAGHKVKNLVAALVAIARGPLAMFWFALNPWHWGMVRKALQSGGRSASMFEEQYWGGAPYRYGDASVAVKFTMKPQSAEKGTIPENPSYDYLREEMVKTLRDKDVYFDFLIQFQEDANVNLIENSMKEWKTPFYKVATIKIPKQEFDSEAQRSYGQNLSFTPWHSIPEHRPLGDSGRARLKSYQALSAFRHERNNMPDEEPDSFGDFEKLISETSTV